MKRKCVCRLVLTLRLFGRWQKAAGSIVILTTVFLSSGCGGPVQMPDSNKVPDTRTDPATAQATKKAEEENQEELRSLAKDRIEQSKIVRDKIRKLLPRLSPQELETLNDTLTRESPELAEQIRQLMEEALWQLATEADPNNKQIERMRSLAKNAPLKTQVEFLEKLAQKHPKIAEKIRQQPDKEPPTEEEIKDLQRECRMLRVLYRSATRLQSQKEAKIAQLNADPTDLRSACRNLEELARLRADVEKLREFGKAIEARMIEVRMMEITLRTARR